jgi:hypothetical protein
MRKPLLLSILLLLAGGFFGRSYAQNQAERAAIISQSNVVALEQLSSTYDALYSQRKAEAYAIARQKGWDIIRIHPDGNISELQYIQEDGTPIYYITMSNLAAAQTTRANRLWSGGGMGLNLNGQGMIVGEWDGGAVRGAHQEFGNRVIQRDGVAFTSHNGNTNHATHVAGTLMGGGVQANAKGMAFESTLWANDWNSDLAEMTSQASQGLILSNHSYGYRSDLLSQWQFGFYDATAANWDELAYNAPFYLMVKAAGNDRGAGYNPGGVFGTSGYNLITGSATSKNVLVVAAVSAVTNYTGPSSVTMSSFSSWGPTDDGRIKPDISGCGVSVYSASSSSNSAYATLSGTSMASPNVTGTMTLLQQHYRNLNGGSFMRSATLRGLVIHTADEAGTTPGPDYRFGWGLLNAEKAANVITQRGTATIIAENVLNNGSSYTINVTASGNGPLEVTICWTDPKGTPLANNTLNSTSARLVNDLDVRVTRSGTTTFPWRLDPAAPANGATQGDNFRDNVEKIIIDNPVAGGVYTITVTHKNSLQGGSQPYSLIVSGLQQSAPSCAIPSNLSVNGITNSAATLSWAAVTGANTYDVRIRVNGTTTWSDFNGRTTNSIGFTGLAEGTTYEWQVRTNCASGSSAYTASNTFTTASSCAAPTGLSVSNLTSTGVTLSWNAVSGASTYDVRIRVNGSATWSDFNDRTTNSIAFTGLTAGTTYEWQVRTNCSGGSSAYTASNTFTAPTAALTYCDSRGNNTNDEWIQRVQIGSINNNSGNNGGYANFTNLSTSMGRGASQSITIVPGWRSTVYNEAYAVWIDWNQNGTFESTELVFSRTRTTATSVSGSFTVPTGAALGATRMRVSMKYNANPTACEVFTYGEVEDYTVNVTASGASVETTAQAQGLSSSGVSVMLYPNPAHEVVNVQVEQSEGTYALRLYNMNGQLVYNQTTDAPSQQIDVRSLPNGVYVLQIEGRGGMREVQKLMIRR